MNTDNEETKHRLRTVLTIAGSDSGGGAGIQADLKTFTSLGLFGTSAITCLTAQHPNGVVGVKPIAPAFVKQQIDVVCENFPIFAAKTGMLYSADIVRAVANADVYEGIAVLVVDPVMISSTGFRLLQADAVDAIRTDLLPVARVVTPNLYEAEIFCGYPINSVEDMRSAARDIGYRYDVACVVTGGHLPGNEVVDVLFDEGEEFIYSAERVSVPQTHGVGCAFSAALTVFLAQRRLLCDSVQLAKEYVVRALEHAERTGGHYPLNFEAAAADMESLKE